MYASSATERLSPLNSALAPQIVLKLAQPLPEFRSFVPLPQLPAPVVESVKRLVDLVTELRSPDSGWSEQKPLTPETLTLYAQEEAQDVWDALQANVLALSQEEQPTEGAANPRSAVLSPLPSPLLWQDYFWLKSLAPWLLWGIARSSYTIMRLMEGQTVAVSSEDEPQRTGMLRLVAVLDLQTPTATHSIDLATYQTVDLTLSPKAMIELPDSDLGASTLTVAALLTAIDQQVQTISPMIFPFMRGIPSELLIPGQRWESGNIQLRLGFEFVPAPLGTQFATFQPSQLAQPLVKVTQPGWLDRYVQTLTHLQLITLLHQMPALYSLHPGQEWDESSLFLLVEKGCQLADRLQANPLISSRGFLQRSLSLNELMARLLWNLLHSSYEVMQLISGVQVSLLQPQSTCQMGILRFAATLKVKLADQEWHLDLATGHMPRSAPVLLSLEAIVQSVELESGESPLLLKQLSGKIWQQLNQAVPEIQQLCHGVEINLSVEEDNWQSGVMQLSGEFEFVAD